MATEVDDEAPGSANNGPIGRQSIKNGPTGAELPFNCCKLSLDTQLRMAKTENAVLQEQITQLLSEKYALEESQSSYYANWQFALMQCGRVTEEKGEAQSKLELLQRSVGQASQTSTTSSGKKARRNELEQLRQTLETQTRVCDQLEQERDRANDDYQSCQAQLLTLLNNYEQLATAAAAIVRERDAAQQEVLVLRQQLDQWDDTREKMADIPNEVDSDVPSRSLSKELSHCKEKLKKVDSLRRQAIKDKQASDSIVNLWQRKHENVVNENRELKEEVLVAQGRISFLQDQLATLRIQYRAALPVSNGNADSSLHLGNHSQRSSLGGSQVMLSQSSSIVDEEVSWI